MLDQSLLDIYTDYLISSFSKTTATGLSQLLDADISHDKITRFLSKYPYSQKEYWHVIKPIVRQMESKDGVMIVDDTLLEKPYSDENRIVVDAWGVFQSGRLPTEDGRKEFRKKTNDSISAEVEKAIGAKTRQEVSSDATMGEREKKVALQGMDALSRVAKGEKNSLYFTFESKSTDFNAFIAGLDTGKISDDVKVALVN